MKKRTILSLMLGIILLLGCGVMTENREPINYSGDLVFEED